MRFAPDLDPLNNAHKFPRVIETAVLDPGVNFMSKKLGVKIPPGGISPNFVKNFPLAFLLGPIS